MLAPSELYYQIDDWIEKLERIVKDISLAEIEPDPAYFIAIRKRIQAIMAEMKLIDAGQSETLRVPEIIVPEL